MKYRGSNQGSLGGDVRLQGWVFWEGESTLGISVRLWVINDVETGFGSKIVASSEDGDAMIGLVLEEICRRVASRS